MNCPCNSDKEYQFCCQLAHESLNNVKTAEALMRSRYTAFTMANGDYLMRSHHSKTRPLKEKQEIVSWAKSVIWVKLEILNTINGLEEDSSGYVEFKAYFIEDGAMTNIHEKSEFVKENGCWVYLGLAK